MNLSRRGLLGAALTVPLLAYARENELAAIERHSGGRLGVFLDDGETSTGHRADERFGLCSTFKLALAAMVLHRADQGKISLNKRLAIRESDRIMHMPSTEPYLGQSMRVVELAEAAQKTSDNLAANLLLRQLGGPAAFNEFCREMGDSKTRLDRYETEMNLVPPGEVRDTTTPRAMAGLLAHLFSADGVSATAQETLRRWMIETQTGLRRLRAGLPENIVAGDKTGTGLADVMHDKINDIAVIWHQGRVITIAAYFEASAANPGVRAADEAVLKDVGAFVATRL